jgi:hypothetical protein
LASLVPVLAWGRAFLLIDDQNIGHGPYTPDPSALILDGQYRIEVRGNGSATLHGVPDAGEPLAPFFLTNQATVVVDGRRYQFLLVDDAFEAAYAIGRDTREMTRAVESALALENAEEGLARLSSAMTTNRLFRNAGEVTNALRRLQQRMQEEAAHRAAGRERFEGRWLPAAEVAQLRRERHDAAMRAKGFENVDGEWLTLDAAREKRLEKVKAEAQARGEAERRQERAKCPRCNGTGSIHYEMRPSAVAANTRGGSKPPDLRIERPGPPPKDSRYQTQRAACPACEGSGRRQ